jgi:hypothetical protein
MSTRRLLPAALIVAAALPATAAARPVDTAGINRRVTTADLDRPAPAPRDRFPWLEAAGLAGLVAAAGAGASTARRRRIRASAPA